LQRLFTTFATGWPGFGLFVQRLVMGMALLDYGFMQFKGSSSIGGAVPEIIAAALGLLILVGLWTPVAGVLVAAIELWIAFDGSGHVWIPIILAIFGGTLAMIGPGAWSIDALLFGRKRLAG
jgi:putative oxidoreductase